MPPFFPDVHEVRIGKVKLPENLDARSLMPVITSKKSGVVDPTRTWTITGRERHVANARKNSLPYPMRAIQTKDFLFIRNYKPERWPMGAPLNADRPSAELDVSALENNTFYCFPDFDASPTKAWMVLNRDNVKYKWHYNMAFGKRPAMELYDLQKDPDQIHNIANNPEYATQKKKGKKY
jgi:N-sulfoglucosamine sulfohydrolase